MPRKIGIVIKEHHNAHCRVNVDRNKAWNKVWINPILYWSDKSESKKGIKHELVHARANQTFFD